jgi:hypothetical protein
MEANITIWTFSIVLLTVVVGLLLVAGAGFLYWRTYPKEPNEGLTARDPGLFNALVLVRVSPKCNTLMQTTAWRRRRGFLRRGSM